MGSGEDMEVVHCDEGSDGHVRRRPLITATGTLPIEPVRSEYFCALPASLDSNGERVPTARLVFTTGLKPI